MRIHQQRRGPQWTNIEEERHLSRHDLTGRVVVIDCVTLWLTNLITPESPEYPEYPENPDPPENPASPAPTATILAAAEAEFDAFTAREATYIFVTNEIGSGGVSPNALQRRFTDLEGWMNQYIAARADEVILMVSGIAVKIK